MEAKQFPEKWAVRNSHKSLEYLSKLAKNNILIDHPYGYRFGYSETNETLYTTYFANIVGATSIPCGYTEVTLEDLIAHYEGKEKVVKCKDNGLSVLTLTVDKEYIVESETTNYFRIADDRGIYGDYAKVRFIDPTTHPKWMPLTQGKEKVKDIVQIDKYFVYTLEKGGFPITCTSEGIAIYVNSCFNLIPYNPRIAELEEKITSKRSELAELESELKTLKGK